MKNHHLYKNNFNKLIHKVHSTHMINDYYPIADYDVKP